MAGRGRGRGAAGGLKGATWDYDPTMKLDGRPTDLYPLTYSRTHPNLRRPAPGTETEISQIRHFKNLQEQIHRGPLFTQSSKSDSVLPSKKFSEDCTNPQYNKSRKAHLDPFFGVETYSMRYAPKMNELPKLSDRPFNKEFFPKELWPTLDGSDGAFPRSNTNRSSQKKALTLGGMSTEGKDRAKNLLEKIHSLGVEGEDGEEEEEVDEQAEMDDEFDDDEIGGDYDAEQYFDGGEGDSDGDGGGADDAY
ncbi:hypothetical protein GcM1_211031 [Golovinomyces cichoracearum]|uniref:DNA-directed RNA polymerase III subunit n=1 Tax=Golovinomyces cichoracearum TaxID=62708 RepID=A0A420IV78_9PEZI|nr:hypothetical protein GcM1_211031 [Golovinomyces cichoracearum]